MSENPRDASPPRGGVPRAWPVCVSLVLFACGPSDPSGADSSGPPDWPDELPQRPMSEVPPTVHGRPPVDLLGARATGDVVRESVSIQGAKTSSDGRKQRRLPWDTRESWSAPLGGEFSLEVPWSGPAVFSSALSVSDADGRAPELPVEALFRLELERDDARVTLLESRVRAGGTGGPGVPHAWSAARAELAIPEGQGPARLVFSTVVRGDAPEGGDDLYAHWGAPVLSDPDGAGTTVLLISIDTLRADHLGCYGYERDTSPTIDALAGEGVLFENCVSPSSWTLPSYASLFTSLHPTEHRAGFRGRNHNWPEARDVPPERGVEAMREDVPTLAGVLGRAGFRTAAIYSNPFLAPKRGVQRDFAESTYYEPDASYGVDLALEWLEQNRGRPGFLFLHLIDPHYPYAAPRPYGRRFRAGRTKPAMPPFEELRTSVEDPELRQWLMDGYDGEIAYADAQLARLLGEARARGLLDDTVTVFHSDHGEEFWDHGGFEHGHSMYRELLHVPLILHAPGRLPGGLRVESQVRAIDVFPTLLQLLGLAPPAGLRGSGLVPVVLASAAGEWTPDLRGYSEGILWSPPSGKYDEAKALITADRKVVLGGPQRELLLFELFSDPGELADLSAQQPGLAADFEQRLIDRHAELSLGVTGGKLVETGADEQQALDHLGYASDD